MARVTYLHHYVRLCSSSHSMYKILTLMFHQLPTLWFSVLMLGSLLDHWIFRSKKITHQTKLIVFSTLAGSVLITFYIFRMCAWGIDG